MTEPIKVTLGYLYKLAVSIMAPKPWSSRNPLETPKSVLKYHDESAQTYSKDVLKSLHFYGEDGHAGINSHLRGQGTGGEYSVDHIEYHISNIDQAMDKTKVDRDTIVFRALMFTNKHPLVKKILSEKAAVSAEFPNSLRIINDGNLQKVKGFTFREPSFLSTSLNSSLSKGAPIRLKVRVPRGTPAIYLNAAHIIQNKKNIAEFTGYRDEFELLLDRGLSYEVTTINSIGDHQIIVTLDVVS